MVVYVEVLHYIWEAQEVESLHGARPREAVESHGGSQVRLRIVITYKGTSYE